VQGPAAKADTKTVFNLETLTFTKPGTYKFTIQETTGQETGVRYDTNTWTATVVVAKGDGGMTATVSYTDSQGNTSTQADFVNSVNTTPGTPYTPVKPTEPEETKKPTEPDVPTTVDDHPEDDKPQEPTVTEGPTQPEGPTITVGPEDSLEDGNEGTGLDKPQEEQPNETAPETSVKPSVAPQTTSSTSLPQTGQDWWPVLLLAAVGVLLIAAGVFHGKKRNI
jgi:pilin isopeptide linkage protein/LPXTG-motif cell wall-anchored protein